MGARVLNVLLQHVLWDGHFPGVVPQTTAATLGASFVGFIVIAVAATVAAILQAPHARLMVEC